MQEAEVVLSVLRERGRQGLPLTQLYRQMFNRELYLLAYGNICVHSRGAVNGCQFRAGSGGSQGLPSMAARMASRAVMPWAAAESR
jgi:hypothetical protein